ncbi:MAG: replication initiator protein A [Asticcacaulis sp.]|uniref:replication initiator protein A n=1 Tax=Asticcacaulis sp. TaxID=1872648 RepID=UPI003F7C43F5
MVKRIDPHPVRDLFIRDIIDYSPKDERTLMERPFFSISKKKRNKPIEYESDDGEIVVKVRANPEFGMATIWDCDILIWLISRVVHERDRGNNMESATVHTTPHELLKGIARDTGGREYRLLFDALNRLHHTSIQTNIRARKGHFATFNWLAEFEGEGRIETPDQMEKVTSLSLTLPPWIFRAITKNENVLTLDREYFLLTGGLDRALYRIARKHAGSQANGWSCGFASLQKKSGSESSSKKFAEMLRNSVKRNELPRYSMTLTNLANGEPAVFFVDRAFVKAAEDEARLAEDLERLARLGREDARRGLIDSGKNPRLADAS